MRFLPLILVLALAALSRAADSPPPPLDPRDPAWSELAATFANQPDATADFSEKRFFPFRKNALELLGVSRISKGRGLSLEYTSPEKRTVIVDEQGLLVREAGGDSAAPADPRAATANLALVRVLRFDLAALATDFELFGKREGANWTLTLIPRATELRRAIMEIVVTGEAAQVRTLVIRRSTKQSVDIAIGPARPTPFSPEDLKRFFR